MKTGILIIVLAGILLAGCVSQRSAAHDECVAGGWKPGTSGYEDCLDVVGRPDPKSR